MSRGHALLCTASPIAQAMDLSIVIPAYRESEKIAGDIRAAGAFLKRFELAGEVIVVDDGSDDDTAGVAGATESPEGVECRVLRHETNRGKGHAIRAGMCGTHARRVMFADSGVCIPFANALRGLNLIDEGVCDIAHGSRRHPGTTIDHPHSFHRRILSVAFKQVVPQLMGVPRNLTDTQCGFKIYDGDVAREVFAECVCDGFMFDVEVILRAQRRGLRITEFPVEWRSDRDSRFPLVKGAIECVRELLIIRRALRRDAERRAPG